MENLLLGFILQYKYPLIVVITVIEGPLIMLASGFFIKMGYLSFFPTYAALMFGDLIGDIFWYFMGYYFGHPFIRRFGKYFDITEEKIQKVEKIFHKYHNHILTISKLTMGFGFAVAVLFTAGTVKIPFKKYITLNVIGQFFWTGFLIFIGYTFGHLYATVNSVISRVAIIAGLIMVFIAILGFGRYMKNRFAKSNKF